MKIMYTKVNIIIWMYINLLLQKENFALKILDFIGPTTIQNGSIPQLVLDCPYTLKKAEVDGLVVKWFYGTVPLPIYQWIPGNKAQDLIFFKGRINTSYVASKSYASKHRALAIISPNTDYSGKYTCSVSSFDTEDHRSKNIIIYSPPSNIKLTYSKPKRKTLLFTCQAEGLYPEPEIHLYRGAKSSDRNRVEALSKLKHKDPKRRSYNVTMHYKLSESDIDQEELFICVITLPGTKYAIQEELLFYKDMFSEPSRGIVHINWCNANFLFLEIVCTVILIINELIQRAN